MATKQCIEQLKIDEGFSKTVYTDTVGIATVGYGYNLKANPQELQLATIKDIYMNGISKEFAEQLLCAEVKDVENELHLRLDFWSKLNAVRQDVLINMGYNLGVEGLLAFKNTLHLIRLGHYKAASKSMLESLWARQVKARAVRLSKLMEVGEYK